MNNVRGLYPPLYGATPSGGGGGGDQHIQVDALPEASLQYKDKIVQYVGATTETITNGYFYKCVEHTETEGETITVTYSWDPVDVMATSSGKTLIHTATVTGSQKWSTFFNAVGTAILDTLNRDKQYIMLLKGSGSTQLYTATLIASSYIIFTSLTTNNEVIQVAKTSSKYYYNGTEYTNNNIPADSVFEIYEI